MSDTLSFSILDDLRQIFRIDLPVGCSLRETVTEAIQRYKDSDDYNEYFSDYLDSSYISDVLEEQKYCVYNRVVKYYVIAFSLNYNRFHVYSKGCDLEVIDWETETNGVVNGPILDSESDHEDYDENPVIKFMNELQQL